MSKQYINRKPRHIVTSLAAAVCFLALFAPIDAQAFPRVYSPYVEKGELELEWQYSHDVDDKDYIDGGEKQKFAVGYGVTDRWFTEIYGEIEKEAGSNRDYKMTAVEWENRFQFTEKGQYIVDVGGLLAYEQSLEDNGANKVEASLLLAKDKGQTSHILNLNLEEEVGDHADHGLATGLAWSSRLRLQPYFEPGFEYHAEFGRFEDHNSFDDQVHQIGPVVYGKLPHGFKYDVGYLFGLSDSTPDGTFRSIIEYEIHL